MIGLMFFGAIGLWIFIAVVLGLKLPKWFKLKPAWSWLFVPLVFFAPVMDEVIALPQANALCKQAEEAFWYDASVKGSVIKKGLNVPEVQQTNVGLNIPAQMTTYAIELIDSGNAAVKWTVVKFSSGFLHMPAGSSGTSMPLLLPEECPSRLRQWPKIDAVKDELQLTVQSN